MNTTFSGTFEQHIKHYNNLCLLLRFSHLLGIWENITSAVCEVLLMTASPLKLNLLTIFVMFTKLEFLNILFYSTHLSYLFQVNLKTLQPYWEAMEELVASDKVLSLGICDLNKESLEDLYNWAKVNSLTYYNPQFANWHLKRLSVLQPIFTNHNTRTQT